jgi:hypothetical protein
MDPKRRRELELEMEQRRRANLAKQGEGEGGEDDGEGEDQPSTAGETFADSVQGGTRGITLGMNDVVAGLGAFAGDLYQSTVDGRPRDPDAYAAGVEEERKRDEAARLRSPRATKRAELAGVLATAPLVAAKPVQLAARAASGAPIATTAVVNAAAPAVARFGRAAVAGALAKLGFDDVDTLAEVPAKALGGAVLGAGGEGLSSLLSSGMATGVRGTLDDAVALAKPGARKAAGRAAGAVDVATDLVPPALLPPGAKKLKDTLRALSPKGQDPPPMGDRSTYDFMQSLGDEFDPLDPAVARALAEDSKKANPLASLLDEPMPTMPPRNPRTPLDQIPKAAPPADPIDELVTARMPAASEPASTVIPVVTKNSSAGNIAQAVEATAIKLGTTDLATIANALKLPTTLASDPLKNAVGRFAFREAVKGAAGKVTGAADDVEGAALRELAAESKAAGGMTDEAMSAINQAKREVPRSLLPGDRPMSQVAGANQGAEMRAAYAALTPEQRVQWIQYLRGQGFADEKIRTMLGVTMRDWRAQSFNR